MSRINNSNLLALSAVNTKNGAGGVDVKAPFVDVHR
jgi:hypothetical protein